MAADGHPGKASGSAEVAFAADGKSAARFHDGHELLQRLRAEVRRAGGFLSAKLCVNREDGKKGSCKPVSWKDRDVRAFEEMKWTIMGKLELFRRDPDKPFILRVDASDRAIGAVLEQKHEQGIGPFGTVLVGFSAGS